MARALKDSNKTTQAGSAPSGSGRLSQARPGSSKTEESGLYGYNAVSNNKELGDYILEKRKAELAVWRQLSSMFPWLPLHSPLLRSNEPLVEALQKSRGDFPNVPDDLWNCLLVSLNLDLPGSPHP